MTPSAGEAASSRVAVVTGASRGIGLAVVRRLAADGYAVVVNCAHDQVPADATVDSILADHGAAVTIRADVTDELDVERLFVETIEAFGRIDVVVHAVVGSLVTGPLTDVTIADFDALYAINTRATFLVNREAARRLSDDGTIVNLTSSQVYGPLPGYGAHTASRAGTDVLTRVLALELAGRGITANALALDVQGPCQAEQVAELVAYLLTDAGRGTTGAVVPVEHAAWDDTVQRNGDGSDRH